MRKYYEKFINRYQRLDSLLSGERYAKLIFGISIIVVFGFILLLNIKYPLYADDWVYLMRFPGDAAIRNFSDILITQYHHYFNWGGRTIAHIIAQSLLLIGSPYNDILNSFAYISISLLIYYISKSERSTNRTLLLWINILLWLFIPAYGPTILNITTSANYLWVTTIIVAFLLPYCLYFQNEKSNDTIPKNILFFIGGIIVGWTNENMSFATIFIVLAFLFLIKKRGGKIYQWSIYGLLGSIIGAAFLLLAPGNLVRYRKEHLSETPQYLQGIYNVLGGAFHNMIIITVIFLVILGFYLFINKNLRIKTDRKLQLSLLFVAAAIIGTAAMIASPIFPDRAWFGIIIFLIIGIVILYASFNFSNKIYKYVNFTLLAICLFICSLQYRTYNDDLTQIHHIVLEREVYLKSQIQLGNLDITFDKPIIPKTRFTDISDFSTDSTFWLNRHFSKYYGIKTMRVSSN